MEGLRQEEREPGIRSIIVSPGVVSTELLVSWVTARWRKSWQTYLNIKKAVYLMIYNSLPDKIIY